VVLAAAASAILIFVPFSVWHCRPCRTHICHNVQWIFFWETVMGVTAHLYWGFMVGGDSMPGIQRISALKTQ
jgi:hypothetical protein